MAGPETTTPPRRPFAGLLIPSLSTGSHPSAATPGPVLGGGPTPRHRLLHGFDFSEPWPGLPASTTYEPSWPCELPLASVSRSPED